MATRTILTHDEIVNRITNIITQNSSNLTDFSPGSDNLAIVKAITAFIEFLQLQNNIAFESFLLSGTDENTIVNRVRDWSIEKKEEVNASGTAKFMRNTAATSDFVIPAGSQISTEPDAFGATLDYTLDDDVTFVSGATYATGTITCTVGGIVGNVPSGTITNITSTINGIDTVTNIEDFTNGADEETIDQLRSRVPLVINGLKKGNEDAIKAAVISVPGITLVRISENVPSKGELTVYVSNQSGVLTQEEVDAVREAAESAAAHGIEVNVATPTIDYITVSMDILFDTINYTKELVKEEIRDAIDQFVEIQSESELQIDDLIVLVKEIGGIKKVKNVKINGVADDYTGEAFAVPRIYNQSTDITINELVS